MKFDLSDKDLSDHLEKIKTKANALVTYIEDLKAIGAFYDGDANRIRQQTLSLDKDGDSLVLLTALKGIINGAKTN